MQTLEAMQTKGGTGYLARGQAEKPYSAMKTATAQQRTGAHGIEYLPGMQELPEFSRDAKPGAGQAGQLGRDSIDARTRGYDLKHQGAGAKGDYALPAMLINVQGTPDGRYMATIMIPDYAMKGEQGGAFADYLANGGMREIIGALLPYCTGNSAGKGQNYRPQSRPKAKTYANAA